MVVRSAQRAYNGCSSSIELGAQHAWPHQTTIKRKSHQTCKHGPALLFMVQCKSWVKTEAAAKKEVSGSSAQLHSRRVHKGPQDQRDSQKGWKNRKASCCTFLKRISKLSLRRSGQSTFTLKRVPSRGSMAPCRSHHGNHTRQEWIFEKIRQELSPVTCKLDDHEPNNNEINGKFINVLGEVLGLASCHKRSNHCRYVKGTSPFDITVTSGRLRWHRNQSHTCAPCVFKKGEDKRKREKFYIYSDVTHTRGSNPCLDKPTYHISHQAGHIILYNIHIHIYVWHILIIFRTMSHGIPIKEGIYKL